MNIRRPNAGARDGGVLVEFALISLLLYLLVGGVLSLGRMVFYAQSAQDVARFAARELALEPLPAAATFEQALADPDVRARIYDPNWLVIDLDVFPAGPALDALFAGLPSVNRAMRPLMIFDRPQIAGVERRLLRFPGALLIDNSGTSPSGFTVAIPRVLNRNADGVEQIEWLPVLQEVRPDPNDPATGSFSALAPGTEQGLVALRLNVPYQSASLAGHRQSADGPFEPNGNLVIPSLDDAVQVVGPTPGGLIDTPANAEESSPYSGPYGLGGLGSALALPEANTVRPFRRLVSAQALFRREVFE